MKKILLTLALACCALPQSFAAKLLGSSPELITLDTAALAQTKLALRNGSEKLRPAYTALLAKADAALDQPDPTVTAKDMTPPSGDKHDYMSMGPYWWPNPDTPNGLPYIRKDGQTNPETKGNGLDSRRIATFCSDVHALSLAYYFSGDTKYARKVAQMLRVWFLNPTTRMNPNLRYGQAIPGIVDGRGIGLIDTRSLWMVIDATALIAPSNTFSQKEMQGLRQWFAQFTDWMVNSKTGHEEDVWYNNHGMFYDAQVINYALFTGDFKTAKQRTIDAQSLRIASQIAKDGRQHAELERTRPFHYSAFNLEAATRIARYGELVEQYNAKSQSDDPACASGEKSCHINVWKYGADGRSIKGAINFLTQAIINPSSWTLFTKEEKALNYKPMIPILLMAERAYQSGQYAQALARITDAEDDINWLLWPLKE